MAEDTLRRRRILVSAVIILLLLPMAGASAMPLPRSESPLAIRLADWSRTLWAPVAELLQHFRPAIQAGFMPPGQKPGNDPVPNPGSREGSGLDPHGRP